MIIFELNRLTLILQSNQESFAEQTCFGFNFDDFTLSGEIPPAIAELT